MAQYLLAVRYADRKFPPEEFRRLCADVPALDAKLEDAGAFVFHGGLLSPESATVVRQSGDDFLITDGPYTETKEHVVGFWVLKAADLNEALAWGRKAAIACRASVEVRPFYYSVEVRQLTGGRSEESNGKVWPPTITEHTPLEPEQNSPTEGE